MLNFAEINPDILDLINVFKWPVIVLICFIVIVFVFKNQIIAIFSKSKKISFEGAGMKFETSQEHGLALKEQSGIQVSKPSLLENATKLFRIETMETFREYVQQETNYSDLGSEKEKFETLLHYSIVIYILKRFDAIYNSIFGSQIALIQYLIAKGPQEINIFEFYYKTAKENFPNAFEDFELEMYPKFLYFSGLIFINQNQRVQVSTLGIDFIKYLTDTGKNIYKEL